LARKAAACDKTAAIGGTPWFRRIRYRLKSGQTGEMYPHRAACVRPERDARAPAEVSGCGIDLVAGPRVGRDRFSWRRARRRTIPLLVRALGDLQLCGRARTDIGRASSATNTAERPRRAGRTSGGFPGSKSQVVSGAERSSSGFRGSGRRCGTGRGRWRSGSVFPGGHGSAGDGGAARPQTGAASPAEEVSASGVPGAPPRAGATVALGAVHRGSRGGSRPRITTASPAIAARTAS
jgi:hypothetical protein